MFFRLLDWDSWVILVMDMCPKKNLDALLGTAYAALSSWQNLVVVNIYLVFQSCHP